MKAPVITAIILVTLVFVGAYVARMLSRPEPSFVEIKALAPSGETRMAAPADVAPTPPIPTAPVVAPPPTPAPTPTVPVLRVGAVSRHAKNFYNTTVSVRGYLLKRGASSIIISDENGGPIGYYDMPVSGDGATAVAKGKVYVYTGVYIHGTAKASNGNPDYLQLSQPPVPEK